MNNLDKYKSLSDNDPDIVTGFNRAIEKAIAQKDENIIQYMLTSSELSEERKVYKEESIQYRRLSLEEFVLIPACDNNFKDLVQFLFTNDNVDREFLYRSLNYGLTRASSEGAFDVVKYLTTSNDLETVADTNFINSPLKEACQHAHLNIVKFLLESPELKTKADLSTLENIYDFQFLCREFASENPAAHMFDTEEERKDYLNRKLTVLQYIILEKNFKKDAKIEQFIEKPENKIIKSIFDARELHQELNNDLNDKNLNKKPKI